MSADVCKPYPWKCNPTEAAVAIDLHHRGLLPIGDEARRVRTTDVQQLANKYRSKYGVDPELALVLQVLEKRQNIR